MAFKPEALRFNTECRMPPPTTLTQAIDVPEAILNFGDKFNVKLAWSGYLSAARTTKTTTLTGDIFIAQLDAAAADAVLIVDGDTPHWSAFATILFMRTPSDALAVKVAAMDRISSAAHAAQVGLLAATFSLGLEEEILAKRHGPFPDCAKPFLPLDPYSGLLLN
ncbi:hypothetical protein AMAG_08374 [Allomyces macrogynus ATCC 38327]|uniref:Uncharacterized protein n=1 Tax=Allomyces macrogynus (strain ATCC 38327) TaxID=578462 RepID=A0A0L0SLG5_ALLM3|nr:hypothetical protein AMAG_08374 [Allomyces macrogynus ATCC 38327]|eukprot:KNE63225.1 hypothetical protein AMAG_08374 [Allomyces macrogynus ATCC 38327]